MSETPQQMPIEIGLGEREAEGIYSNVVFITHSPAEVILDFARLLPGSPKARVFSRIVMTPSAAKGLLAALGDNLQKYETQYGEIRTPSDAPRRGELGFTGRVE
jgi:hypothetical protein